MILNRPAANLLTRNESHQRSDRVVNYELDRKTSQKEIPAPRVSRISVAVVVDSARVVDGDGKLTHRTWTAEELESFRTIVAKAVGLDDDDVHGDDWSACQAVGHAAWFLHVQGVLVPAAGGIGLVITAYEQRTHPGQLQVISSEELTPTRYRELREP